MCYWYLYKQYWAPEQNLDLPDFTQWMLGKCHSIILRLPNQFMAHSPHQIIENFSQLPYPAFVLVALCSLWFEKRLASMNSYLWLPRSWGLKHRVWHICVSGNPFIFTGCNICIWGRVVLDLGNDVFEHVRIAGCSPHHWNGLQKHVFLGLKMHSINVHCFSFCGILHIHFKFVASPLDCSGLQCNYWKGNIFAEISFVYLSNMWN